MKLEEVLQIPGIKKIKRASWPSSQFVQITEGVLKPPTSHDWTIEEVLANDWVPVDPTNQLETYVLTRGDPYNNRFRYLLRGPQGMDLVAMMRDYCPNPLRRDNTDIVAQFIQMLMAKHGFEMLKYVEACIR